ncbi:growth hormone-regulated TBC protein 1-like isoform X2 [Hylaeus volcanicus]|uniref:growth hormone-regulated TBC protein 1-like isoform X2 n=1 Tax=Hylaeus volcanicus TaxID=313075 RepID=UPI0023B83855|nr:growth hormone-regulated TBC protein 1-like isoform X2 [Hylaeus volcanicus]
MNILKRKNVIVSTSSKLDAFRNDNSFLLSSRFLSWTLYRNKAQESRCHYLLSKRLIRRGIPDDLRSEAWSYLLGSYELLCRLPSRYTEYVKKAEYSTTIDTLKQIEMDVTRTFPTHAFYQTSQGIGHLRNVLRAFSVHNPEINYCQGLNFLAGVFLLYMKEDIAFWSLVQMVSASSTKGLKISDYYTRHLFGLRRDIKTLRYLMKRHTSKALSVLNSQNIELDCICAEWFLCSFSTVFPFPVFLRIWDILFREGKKIFFRISLAIFKIFEKKTFQSLSFESIVTFFKTDLRNELTVSRKLLHIAFHGIGHLKRSAISYFEHKASIELVKELKSQGIYYIFDPITNSFQLSYEDKITIPNCLYNDTTCFFKLNKDLKTSIKMLNT